MPVQVLSTPAIDAPYNRAGTLLAYSDQKGFEMEWRKHDTSSFARDVWMWDVATNRHTRLTDLGFDDRQPVWSPDERSLLYLSERSGSFNVWRLDLADPTHPVQVTRHATHPVRFLSASRQGDLCYAWDGEIYVRPAGATESRKLAVTTATDRRQNDVERLDVGSEVSEFAPSPDGKEVAFVARGEVFVASTEHGTTRRITTTPEQERSVSFSPDGTSLLYASERDGSWNVYRTDRTDPDEPAFFNATALKETPVIATPAEEFQPRFSPDGKEVAYLEERTILKVVNLATGATRTVLPGELQLLLLGRRPVVRVVPGRPLVCRGVPQPHPVVRGGRPDPLQRRGQARQPHQERLRGRPPPLGRQGRRADLGDRPPRCALPGRVGPGVRHLRGRS